MDHSLSDGGRLDMLDAARGIGMLFVVFAHVNYTPVLLTLIYSFHMPLFFIISGMVFRRDRYPDFASFLKRRLRRLILPYLVCSLLSMGYVFLSCLLFPGLFSMTGAEYWQAFLQIFTANWSGPVLNTPLWFVPCLFAVEIGYYFISRLKAPAIMAVTFLLACLGWAISAGLLGFDGKCLPWALDSALYALSFYALGNLAMPVIRSACDRLRESDWEEMILLGIIAVCILLWLPPALFNGKISLGSKVLGNGFLLFLSGTIGSCGVFAAAMLGRNSRFLEFCGRHSFWIMAVHYMIRKYTLPKCYALLDLPLYDRKDPGETIVPFLAVLALSLLTAWIWERIPKKRTHP